MYPAISQAALVAPHRIGARSASKGFLTFALACALTWCAMLAAPLVARADPSVEFDIARAVECRDVTPYERLAQYPAQRLIEVALPVSVRFNDVSRDDVDEVDIEVSGAAAGLRVQDFAPTTQLASEITHEIETTTTIKKSRSLDGTLGGSLPIPGADVAARVTPSITAGLSGCETATEKINRLPPKHVVVVSGTYAEGRGVFFKLKRTSQTSLEGVHELAVTFVAPRTWPAIALQVECSALGQRKMLWMKQPATLGHAQRYVQLVAAAPAPVRQIVLKPTDSDTITTETTTIVDKSAASPTRWRPVRVAPAAAKTSDGADAAPTKRKSAAVAATESDDESTAAPHKD
ncbi:MAG: hypothetical protein WD468_01205 [Pirellulales bacterium]